ncbi:MAG: FAD binding domain-containing protein, partial [Pseudolabrys sp.]
MDALPDFRVLTPATLDEALAARAANPGSQPLGGGTDLVVNIRRGIVAPPVLIDMNHVAELGVIKANADSLEIGASVRLSEIAEHPAIVKHYPVLAQAAAHIAGPT